MKTEKKCVVLLSGGIDSTTCLAVAKDAGLETFALTFNYEQRHKVELQAARRVALAAGVTQHLVLDLPLGKIGGSALTSNLPVPRNTSSEEIGTHIPVTYVPARNTIFLAFALGWAEVLGIEDIFIGVNALDYSGYPDCRPEYIRAFTEMANLATKMTVEGAQKFAIKTPLIHLTKAEIILAGTALGVDYSLTHSCYDPDAEGLACGACDSCILRRKGFAGAGLPDPTRYA